MSRWIAVANFHCLFCLFRSFCVHQTISPRFSSDGKFHLNELEKIVLVTPSFSAPRSSLLRWTIENIPERTREKTLVGQAEIIWTSNLHETDESFVPLAVSTPFFPFPIPIYYEEKKPNTEASRARLLPAASPLPHFVFQNSLKYLIPLDALISSGFEISTKSFILLKIFEKINA